MSRRYSFEDTEEAFQPSHRQQPAPAPAPETQLLSSPRRPQQQPYTTRDSPTREHSYDSPQTESTPLYHEYPPQTYSPPRSPPKSPAAHPDSAFNRLQAQRRHSQQRDNVRSPQSNGETVTASAVPVPPIHRDAEGRIWGRELGYTNSAYSNITPGADNFGETAAGGLSGVAMSVADQRARESGLEAMRNTPGYNAADEMHMHDYQDSPYRHPQDNRSPFEDPYQRTAQYPSQSSLTPIGAAAFPAGMSTPHSHSTVSRSPPASSFVSEPYVDNPYQQQNHRYSRNLDPSLATQIDPNSIEDDGDDGLDYRAQHRSSMPSLGHHSDRGPSAGGAVASGGLLGTVGGLLGRSHNGSQAEGSQYDPVRNTAYAGANEHDLGSGPEKSEWLSKQSTGKKKLRWLVGIILLLVIAGAIAGGIVGAMLNNNKKEKSDAGKASAAAAAESAEADTAQNGVLTKDSDEIKQLMSNDKIHKVFPGVDYTPMYTQYPDCLHYPASQNNVTRDLAVLSQMTNIVRLYGTDCNQTELVIQAIDHLGLTGQMKIWMGVWIDKNETTNTRQLEQMYDIFEKYKADPFLGVIIGNEVLFRKDKTEAEMAQIIKDARDGLSQRQITGLKIASSDLGDNWRVSPEFAEEVDVVMANIHPFFAGVTASEATAWTYKFWVDNDRPLKAGLENHVISEVGWPSKGGTSCGGAASCTTGSVASVSEMNTFMEGWICASLANSTNYFWFEAFDEPWKWKFNEPGKEWEDQWGLMDVNRNLKPGITIPDCGGKTVAALS